MPPPRLDAATLAAVKAAHRVLDDCGPLAHTKYSDEIVTAHGDLITTNDDVSLAEAITVVVNAAPALVAGCETLLALQAFKPRIQKWRDWTSDELAEGANDIFTDLLAALDAAREE